MSSKSVTFHLSTDAFKFLLIFFQELHLKLLYGLIQGCCQYDFRNPFTDCFKEIFQISCYFFEVSSKYFLGHSRQFFWDSVLNFPSIPFKDVTKSSSRVISNTNFKTPISIPWTNSSWNLLKL